MTAALSATVRDAVRKSDRRIVITGAGGWLGMATLELLGEALGPALAVRVSCFGASRRTLTLLTGDTVEQSPLEEVARLPPAPSLVLHLAFLTKDRAEAMPEADYRRANRALTKQLLDVLENIDARAVFVASSGATCQTTITEKLSWAGPTCAANDDPQSRRRRAAPEARKYDGRITEALGLLTVLGVY